MISRRRRWLLHGLVELAPAPRGSSPPASARRRGRPAPRKPRCPRPAPAWHRRSAPPARAGSGPPWTPASRPGADRRAGPRPSRSSLPSDSSRFMNRLLGLQFSGGVALLQAEAPGSGRSCAPAPCAADVFGHGGQQGVAVLRPSACPPAMAEPVRILMLTSWSEESTPGRVVDGVGVDAAAVAREFDASGLGQAQVGALADHLDPQLDAVDADGVVGLVADLGVGLVRAPSHRCRCRRSRAVRPAP